MKHRLFALFLSRDSIKKSSMKFESDLFVCQLKAKIGSAKASNTAQLKLRAQRRLNG
jgi:hypothetical protein